MRIEMTCPRCFRPSTAELEKADREALDQMFEGAPVYALGDGETFEDMISTALSEHEPMHCPHCGGRLQYSEEALGQLAMDMLVRM
jgi:hypothetical protein